MKSKIINFLDFLQVLDREKKLSITNIAVIVIVGKMAISPFDWATAASLFVALINYLHKRTAVNKARIKAKQDNELENLAKQVQTITQQMESVVTTNAETTKQAEEVKRILSTHSNKETIGNAFLKR